MGTEDGLIFLYLITPISIVLDAIVMFTLHIGFNNEPINVRFTLLKSLSTSELMVSVVGFSLQTFFKSYETCVVAGHVISSFSLISLTHMVSLTIERFITIKYPFKAPDWLTSKKVIATFLLVTWLYGLIWGSLFNIIGWGEIVVESKETNRCSIDFMSTDPIRKSYIYCLLAFCYIIPILCTLALFFVIKRELQKMQRFIAANLGQESTLSQDMIKEEKKFSILVATMLFCFLVSWTPYALSVFYREIKENFQDSVFFDICACFGKTSSLWNPIIYFFIYKKFRNAFLRLFPLIRRCKRQLEASCENNQQNQNITFSPTYHPEPSAVNKSINDTPL